jgi:hypothetical protein
MSELNDWDIYRVQAVNRVVAPLVTAEIAARDAIAAELAEAARVHFTRSIELGTLRSGPASIAAGGDAAAMAEEVDMRARECSNLLRKLQSADAALSKAIIAVFQDRAIMDPIRCELIADAARGREELVEIAAPFKAALAAQTVREELIVAAFDQTFWLGCGRKDVRGGGGRLSPLQHADAAVNLWHELPSYMADMYARAITHGNCGEKRSKFKPEPTEPFDLPPALMSPMAFEKLAQMTHHNWPPAPKLEVLNSDSKQRPKRGKNSPGVA